MSLPAAAVAWLEAETGGRAVAAEPVAGATTVEIHRLTVAGGRHPGALVIRRYAVSGYLAEWPGRPAHEAAVLRGLAASVVPAPVLIAVDADGARCDVPAVLMSAVPGTPDQAAAASQDGCAAMAAALASLHQIDPGGAVARSYRPYSFGLPGVTPPWTSHSGSWEAASAIVPPEETPVLIHRDFHPGNLLWEDGALAGIVDWGEACRGPGSVDVAHCRVNLALIHGPGPVASFTTAYEAATGSTYDRRWDVRAGYDLLPHYGGSEAVAAWPNGMFPEGSRRRLDAFLAEAIAAE